MFVWTRTSEIAALNPALFTLLKLRWRGMIRRALRSVKTPRGAVYAIIVAVMFVWGLVPAIVMRFVAAHKAQAASDPTFRQSLPLVLLAFCLLSSFVMPERSIFFRPAEVNFLFSGPFSRRQLVLYKLLMHAWAALFSALIFATVLWQYTYHWLTGFVGFFLALLLVQLFSTAFTLASHTLAERVNPSIRPLALLIALSLLLAGLWTAGPLHSSGSMAEVMHRFNRSPIGLVILAPFEVFARAITAERIFPDLAVWGSLAAAIDGTLIGLILWLDRNYLEISLAASEKMSRWIQQRRRGRGLARWRQSGRIRLPLPPTLRGAGPILWRSAVDAMRQSPVAIPVLIGLAAMVGPILKLIEAPITAAGAVCGMVVYLSCLFVPQVLAYDFRGDLDCFDFLKSLPLSSWGIAIGELIVPVLIATVADLAFVAGMVVFVPEHQAILAMAAALSLPLNLFLFGLQNLLFLLFPSRAAADGGQDFDTAARTMVELLLRTLAVGICGALAAGAGAIAYYVAGESFVALGVASWLTLTACALATVPLVAAAFKRFDVSLHTPG